MGRCAASETVQLLALADGAALVEVADNGPGIPAHELTQVLRAFHRGEGSRNRASGGLRATIRLPRLGGA